MWTRKTFCADVYFYLLYNKYIKYNLEYFYILKESVIIKKK